LVDKATLNLTNPDEKGWTTYFSIERARFDGRWDPSKAVRLVLEFDVADGITGTGTFDPTNFIKDVYARINIKRWLKFQAGHFKRPFSRIRLTSPWDLLIPERGLIDDKIVGKRIVGGFGGRSIGVMALGQIKEALGLRYYVGFFSGFGFLENYEHAYRDIVGRIEIEPLSGFKIGVNDAFKLYYLNEKLQTVNLLGMDIGFEMAGFSAVLEGDVGKYLYNYTIGDSEEVVLSSVSFWGAHATVAYEFALGDSIKLTPAFMAEYLNAPVNDSYNGYAWRIAGGINLVFLKYCKVAIFGEGLVKDLYRFKSITYTSAGTFQSSTPEKVRYPSRVVVQFSVAL
jgi:hypothetical protein